MTVEAQKKAAVIVASTVGIGLAVAGIVAYVVLGYPNGHPSGAPRKEHVVVEKGLTLHEIARRLADKGLIDHPSWFRFYANERGLAQKIRAGDYELTSAMSPKELLDRLVEGVPVEETSVTIPEGKNMEQVAEILGAAGVCSAADALKVMRDAGLARSLGVPDATFEG